MSLNMRYGCGFCNKTYCLVEVPDGSNPPFKCCYGLSKEVKFELKTNSREGISEGIQEHTFVVCSEDECVHRGEYIGVSPNGDAVYICLENIIMYETPKCFFKEEKE